MSDPKPEPFVPAVLPVHDVDAGVTDAIRAEIPGVLDWLSVLGEVDVTDVPPFDPARDLKPVPPSEE